MKCTCCGKEITASDRFCPYCGQNNINYVEPVRHVEESEPARNQTYSNGNNNQYNDNYNRNYNYQNNQPVYVKVESKAIGVLAIVFSALGGWLGLVFSIIGLSTYKEPSNRTLCKIGLGLFIGWIVLYIIVLCV